MHVSGMAFPFHGSQDLLDAAEEKCSDGKGHAQCTCVMCYEHYGARPEPVTFCMSEHNTCSFE